MQFNNSLQAWKRNPRLGGDFTQATAPLPGHTTGGHAFLGEAAGVHDDYGVGVAQGLGHMLTQLGHDRLIVPGTGTDEVLYWLALAVGQIGDGFGGLALEFAEFALKNHLSQLALLLAVEAWQVAS